jgi:hypothetical protein
MSSIILSLLTSHLLTIIEDLIEAAEPTIVAEVQLLISKLEAYVGSKSTAVAAVVNPVLEATSAIVPADVASAATLTSDVLNAAA